VRRWSFWVVLVVMILVNTVTREFNDWLSVPAAALGVAVLLGIARWDGLSWHDLGLSPAEVRRGLAIGAVVVAIVMTFYAIVLASPWDSTLENSRTPDTLSLTLLSAFLIIPIQTVIWEEVAFRGVLWAHVRRDHGTVMATVVSSVLFGLWHILPATGFATSSSAVTDNADSGSTTTVITVLVTVLFTGLAGVLLCELRRRTDSLVTPMAIHWATNGLGLLASYVALTYVT